MPCLQAFVRLSEFAVRVNNIIFLNVINDYLLKESVLYCKNKFIFSESLGYLTILRILTITENTLVATVLFNLPVL